MPRRRPLLAFLPMLLAACGSGEPEPAAELAAGKTTREAAAVAEAAAMIGTRPTAAPAATAASPAPAAIP